jgi:hypothetical protein
MDCVNGRVSHCERVKQIVCDRYQHIPLRSQWSGYRNQQESPALELMTVQALV